MIIKFVEQSNWSVVKPKINGLGTLLKIKTVFISVSLHEKIETF